ncbi:TPA: DUF1190 domain-containing protein [Vibrio campbellii]|uniref:DUF1190 domain-containing protein n=1 Tax=Vibrio sp. M260121 TaxID=3020897 RepID=UPI002F3F44BD|nr:DUF1190 domain-containing protein [Vibrio campbellii]HDM8241629.1 DUF1190 domain-containing protein [Vibrio campbellii]
MKRSSNVKRSSMDKSFKVGRVIPFVAFGGIFFLATHESKTEGYIYTDADECKSDIPEFSEQCEIAYQEAMARAEENAPRYNNEFECEDDFYEDDCYYSSRHRSYVPNFGGYFFSRAVSGLSGYNKSYYSEPMYRYKSKYYNGAGQFYGSYRNQSTKVATSNLNKRGGGTIGRAMSRGGFGKAVSVSRGG